MKKMIAMLFAGLLFSAPVCAQNFPTNYYANAVGNPGFTINSGGSNFGQMCSSASASSWSLNYGTAQLTCGTAALTWDSTPLVTSNAPFATKKTAFTGVYASTAIAASSSYETILSSASTVTLTSTPSIATGVSGQWLVLSSTATGGSVVFTDEGTLTGSKLQLGAATRTITAFKTLTLIYDAEDGYWHEIAFGNN